MNGGWIKLHRQTLNNEVFRHDPTAWRVFEVLLLLADKKNAEWSGGLFQLVGYTGIKKDALYKAVKRLEQSEMITRRVNTKYTVYRICKWSDFQGNETGSVNAEYTESKTPVKREYTQSKTLTRKRIENKNKEESSVFDELNTFWSEAGGRRLSDNKTARSSLNKLLKEHSVDEIKFAIKGAVYFQGMKYKPQVMSFASLYEKWDNLVGHMRSYNKEVDNEKRNII